MKRSLKRKITDIKSKLNHLNNGSKSVADEKLLSDIRKELDDLENLTDNENESSDESLRSKEIDLENLVNNAFDGITINDAKGDYVFANESAAKISGYTTEELLRLNVRDLSPPSELDEIWNRSLNTIQGKNVSNTFESRMVKKDGTIIPIEIAAARTTWQGKPGDMVFIRDISERKENEELIKKQNKELKNLNSVKNKFFSIIGHDLKNPIHQLQGFSELMLANLDDYNKDKLHEFLELIHSSAKYTYNLLEDLLMWSRAQSGRVPYNPQKISLGDLITDGAEIMKPSAKYKNIDVSVDIPSYYSVYADYDMIRTVIRNLLSNAIKFTPEGKNVNIGGKKYNEFECLIYISDEGIGMSEEIQDSLFKLDKHISKCGTKDESGTGLGLIVSKEFVDKNGGNIWFTSEEGKGTSFFFTLKQYKD